MELIAFLCLTLSLLVYFGNLQKIKDIEVSGRVLFTALRHVQDLNGLTL